MSVSEIHPLTLSTVWHAMQRICREMRHLIDRTSQFYLISQMHDISVGIWDASGDTVAIPVGLTAQYVGGKFSVRYILNEFQNDLYPGDALLVNDPYHGYTCHAPDWGVFRPIFYNGELSFFTLARAHMEDTGAAYPGAYFSNPYDIHSEGILIPPTKILEKGKEKRDILRLIFNNVRLPENVRVDVQSLVAATQLCEDRMVALLDRYGRETVLACVQQMKDRSERAIREAIRQIPDGTYFGESATDNDGVELDTPVWIRCEVTVKDDEMVIDFSPSDPAKKGAVNAQYMTTYSCAFAAAILFFDPALADYHNEGSMCPITIRAREGSVLNAQYPAPGGTSPVNVGGNIIEAVTNALSKALPHRAVAAWGRRFGHYVYGNHPRTGQLYVYPGYEAEGGAGAVYGFDGYHGTGSMGTLGEIVRPNTEDIEIKYPWRTIRREYRMDSCGAGRWRGGPGMEWEAVNEGEECGMHTGAGHGETTFGPGAMGGQSTPANVCYILRGEHLHAARCHKLHQILPGDHVIRKTGGGAGVGRPEERDPQKVWEDVFIHKLVSLEAAREVYKVVIDPIRCQIAWEATVALRSAAMATPAEG